VVVSVQEHSFRQAFELLQKLGGARKTDYYNVVTLHVADPGAFPIVLQQAIDRNPALQSVLARVMPVVHTFTFQSPEELQHKASQALAHWLEKLSGHSFYVRMHRRGFKERISSQREEQRLGHWLIDQLCARGETGRITFDDPDYIIALETVGQRAGVSLWDRDERQRYAFLKLTSYPGRSSASSSKLP
jgi:tRNA(Ser,Leu) C12 N-acetylase TAN1